MISDEERREAAAWLRGEIGSGCYWPGSLRMSEAFGVPDPKGPGYEGRLLARLADLIEPSIPADPGEAGLASVDGFIRERTGKPVDREALLELAGSWQGFADTLDRISCDGPVGVISAVYESLAWELRRVLGVEDG